MQEMRFMFSHMERKSNELIFRKCPEPRCNYCPENPVKALQLWNYLRDQDFKWPNPMPSPQHPGHYMTYMELENIDKNSLKTGKVLLY